MSNVLQSTEPTPGAGNKEGEGSKQMTTAPAEKKTSAALSVAPLSTASEPDPVEGVFRQIRAFRDLRGLWIRSQPNGSGPIERLEAESVVMGHVVIKNGEGKMVDSFGLPRNAEYDEWLDYDSGRYQWFDEFTSEFVVTSHVKNALSMSARMAKGPFRIYVSATMELTEASTRALLSRYPEDYKRYEHVAAIARDINGFGYGFTVEDIFVIDNKRAVLCLRALQKTGPVSAVQADAKSTSANAVPVKTEEEAATSPPAGGTVTASVADIHTDGNLVVAASGGSGTSTVSVTVQNVSANSANVSAVLL